MAVSFSVIGAEVPVTLEMIHAGGAILRAECQEEFGSDWCNDVAWRFARAAYLAMRALEPVELVSAGELAALKERDEAIKERDEARKRLGNWRKRAFSAICDNAELRAETTRLHDTLAQRPAPNAPDPPKPNPFRDFTTDPRRMGL